MAQEDSRGTENPPEKDNGKKDTIPPEGSSKPEPEASSKPEPEGSTQPVPEGSAQPAPEGSAQPAPEGSAQPELEEATQPKPEGSTQPEPEGSAQPEPEGSSLPEPSDRNTPQSLKAKSKICKKSKAVKVKNNGSQQILGKKQGNSKKVIIPPEGSSKPEPKPEPKRSSKPEAEGSRKQEPEGSTQPAPEGSSQPEPSDKNTPRSLKAEPKIFKKHMAVKVMTNGSQQIHGKRRRRKNKKVVGNSDEPPKEKSPGLEKIKEKNSQSKSTNDGSPIERRYQAGKNKNVELDKIEPKQRNKEKRRESGRGTRSRSNKFKRSGMVNTESSEKKQEKLGGFIFMCSGKTKPDCFRFRVMGVSAAKKDVVLGVKPGMKLFLYDFDLKLLYGIFKASSSGGMKLEPRAFGGNFPAQVRFTIACDCFPLPESIFRKAIKENYNERHKFKTDLTVRQVRKLTELFRPVAVRSSLQPVYSPPKAIIWDEEDPDGVRASWPHLHRERAAGDPYNVLSHERDPRVEQREEIPRNLFLSEKSYRAYGLQGDGRNVASASQLNPIMESYRRDYEREPLHHLDPIYRENVTARVKSLHADPHCLNESEHLTYFHGAISDRAEDPYHAYRYGASPGDLYLPPLSREDISSSSYGGRTLIGADNLQRRETVHDRHYSAYSAADAFADYDRAQQYHREKLDATAVPVSSRYSFAGPSYSLR